MTNDNNQKSTRLTNRISHHTVPILPAPEQVLASSTMSHPPTPREPIYTFTLTDWPIVAVKAGLE
ncbi:hypothetical protein KCP74_25115 [Salmonella enterica subsp. enterica]|nr:hypothetical protein KCP74_25115 [Salmonella enterica subsp. enterica]